MTAPLLSVRDLSVAFRQGERETLAVDRISFEIKRARRSRWSANPVGQVGDRAVGDEASAYPAAHHPSGSITFKGQELLSLPEHEIRHVRGNDITIIFQEPMTSLNPLHTIERQIGEILAAQRHHRRGARKRTVELLDQVGIPDPASRLAQLSASALGRPAPARDDRHGARQRARPADRRRADDRARRHRAGADPQAVEGAADPARHGDAVHHPRPRHRAQARRHGLRDEARARSSSRARWSGCSPRRSIPIRARCSPPSPSATRRRCSPHAPVVIETDGPQGLVPDQARRAAPHRRAHQGGRRREHRGAQGRDARHRRRVRARARPRSGSPSCG